jgi:putative phage-type endonuclease
MSSCLEFIPYEQGSPEWHKFRKNGIGASETASIIGKDPKCTPYQRWQQKLGIIPGPKETEPMKRGKELEPVAREEFIKKTGIEMVPCVIKNHSTPSFMFASLDGLSPCGKYALEIKIPWKEHGYTHSRAMNFNEIPENYIPQLNKQALISNVEVVFYYSWNENSSKIIEFHRDSNLEKEILEKEIVFWECIENFKEPAFTERDFVNMSNNPEWIVYSNSLKEASNRRKEAEKQEEEYRKKLIELADNQCCQGNDLRLTKYVRKGNIDTKKIVLDYNIDEEKYRKDPIIGWRVS